MTKIILEAIGKGHIAGLFYFIEKNFTNNDPEIINCAIRAAGLSMSPEFIDKLIQSISDQQYSENARKALALYGVDILTFLDTTMKDESKKLIHNKIPSIVENIESQKSVSFLFYLLESEDILVRNEALNSLTRLKSNFPYLHFEKNIVIKRILDEARIIQDTLSVLYLQTKLERDNSNNQTKNDELIEARKSLIVLLERRLDGSLDRIFGLLGLKYSIEEINSAHKSFQSNKPDIRLSSIEFLDNLLNARLKRVLIPIFETTTLETISKEALQNLNIHIPNEIECYTMLLEGNDIKIKISVLYLIGHINDKKYIPLLQKYQNNSNQKVSDFSKRALNTLT